MLVTIKNGSNVARNSKKRERIYARHSKKGSDSASHIKKRVMTPLDTVKKGGNYARHCARHSKKREQLC